VLYIPFLELVTCIVSSVVILPVSGCYPKINTTIKVKSNIEITIKIRAHVFIKNAIRLNCHI
jgi:hypothetical protein